VSTSASATAPTRLPRAERRAQIVRAAASAFVAAGFDGTSMDDVARAAGVTRLIVYRIFETKEALYRAVLDGVAERLIDEFESSDLQFAERRMLAVARADTDAFRLLFRHAANEPRFVAYHLLVRERAQLYVDGLLADRIAEPALRRWVVPAIIDHVVATTLAWLDHGDPAADDDFVRRHRNGVQGLIAAWLDG
jgi:AcrR family transcriptional regulator